MHFVFDILQVADMQNVKHIPRKNVRYISNYKSVVICDNILRGSVCASVHPARGLDVAVWGGYGQ